MDFIFTLNVTFAIKFSRVVTTYPNALFVFSPLSLSPSGRLRFASIEIVVISLDSAWFEKNGRGFGYLDGIGNHGD